MSKREEDAKVEARGPIVRLDREPRVHGRDALTHADDGSRAEPAPDWLDWMPVPATRNWCRDDALLDWLDLYGAMRGFLRDDLHPDYQERYDYWQVVYAQAARFGAEVIRCLRRHAEVTTIAASTDDGRSLNAAVATVDAMQRGDPIISRGVLRDAETRVYGIPALLVRSDVLARVVPSVADELHSAHGSTWLPTGAHYCVVDVRFATLRFTKDGRLSTDLAYLAQAWMFNRALGRVQGFRPSSAFLLGRSWEQGERRGRGCLERLGRVTDTEVVGREKLPVSVAVTEALAWLRRVRSSGREWAVSPSPTVPELWPNMKEHDSAPWTRAKRQIAAALEDLTLLWRVGPENRACGHREGVFQWTDARVSSQTLGMNGRRAEVLDAILAVNRSGGPVIRPSRIEADEGRWRTAAPLEFFVDFETVTDLNDTFTTMPERGGQALIFQVGCGRVTAQGWTFRQFTAQPLTLEGEREMLDAWCSYVVSEAQAAGVELAETRLVHWSPAETSTFETAYNSARARHAGHSWPSFSWYDLLTRVVSAEPVTVRGAFGFGLKEVANAMHRHGLIRLSWPEGPTDGLAAMAGALRAGAGSLRDDPEFLRAVSVYNEADCRIMHEVLAHLRANF